jgi:hypothetical protein
MPLPGGASGKAGVHYEDKWTAYCALEVLRERASSIRVEPPGAEESGIEFWLQRDTCTEYHQVKRQRKHGEWTVAALREVGVLKEFEVRLRDRTSRCVFVSMQSASVFRELTEYARKATSHSDFVGCYLQAEIRRKEYEVFRTIWPHHDDQKILNILSRIYIQTISEELLESMLRTNAELLFEREATTTSLQVIRILQRSIHETLHADKLWRQLAEEGVQPATWRGTKLLATQIAETNRRYVTSRVSTLIGNKIIARAEAKRLARALDTERQVLICGDAGSGKSDILLQLVQSLEQNGVPHLVFRLDRLPAVAHPGQLAQPLGLPTSPVAALAALAGDRIAILIIDQLDIVSTTSGRQPEFFDCVEQVISQASALPNMRLVVACRTFDVENDSRLRQLLDKSRKALKIEVGRLDEELVRSALGEAGFVRFQPSTAQLELLRIPLHLSLLCDSASDADDDLAFASSNDLFERFWKHKRREVEQRRAGTAWLQIIDVLVDHISATRTLFAPRELVDEWELDVDILISSNVLRRDGQLLAFSHEAFFDYAFARRSVERRRGIRDLLNVDQLLFRRAQVRQMLEYSRERMPLEFREDVRFLISDTSVRFHLKAMVMEWLRQVQPDSAILTFIAPLLLDDSSELFTRAWGILTTEMWFQAADEAGYIAKAFGANEAVLERVCGILWTASTHSPSRVATLLRPHVDSACWRRRVAYVLEQPTSKFDKDLFTLCRLFVVAEARSYGRESVAQQVLISTVRRLAKDRPDCCAVLIGEYLRASFELAKELGQPNLFDYSEGTVAHDLYLHNQLLEIAHAVPALFIEQVVSVLFDIANHTMNGHSDIYLSNDLIWWGRYTLESYGTHNILSESLLQAAEKALREYARIDSPGFIELLDRHADGDSDTIAFLLAQGFASNPSRLADPAIEFLLADQRRLSIGNSAERYWGTRDLLFAVCFEASRDNLLRIQDQLLAFSHPYERLGDFGRTQQRLLSAIPVSRQSPSVRRRLAELHRKFGNRDLAGPRRISAGLIQSPIERTKALRMKDQQWRRAIAKYSTSRRDSKELYPDLKGGADELANELEDAAKEFPERFAQLAILLPDETSTSYFDAILRGVASTTYFVGTALASELIERCHNLPQRPCGRWIGGLFRRMASDALSAQLYEIITWYALHDPDPVDQRETGDLLHRGLNSVRGQIATTVAALIAEWPEHFERLITCVRSLVSDHSPSVRAMAAEILLMLSGEHRAEMERLFVALLSGASDELINTHFIQQIIWRYANSNMSLYRPTIERMLTSPNEKSRANGSRNAVGVSLAEHNEESLALRCRTSDDVPIRVAAAETYGANLTTARFRAVCEEALRQFFIDPDARVRGAASKAIWSLVGDGVARHAELCEIFLSSVAFAEQPYQLIHALKLSTIQVPALLLRTSADVFSLWESGRQDLLIRRDTFSLVVRAYTNAQGRSQQEQALDLIDRALRSGLYGLAEDLDLHDRGWL